MSLIKNDVTDKQIKMSTNHALLNRSTYHKSVKVLSPNPPGSLNQ